jgi:hypothetical protein
MFHSCFHTGNTAEKQNSNSGAASGAVTLGLYTLPKVQVQSCATASEVGGGEEFKDRTILKGAKVWPQSAVSPGQSARVGGELVERHRQRRHVVHLLAAAVDTQEGKS